MEFVSFQKVERFVQSHQEKEQNQHSDGDSFLDVMKKAPEQVHTEKEQDEDPKKDDGKQGLQNGNIVILNQPFVLRTPEGAPIQSGQDMGILAMGNVRETAADEMLSTDMGMTTAQQAADGTVEAAEMLQVPTAQTGQAGAAETGKNADALLAAGKEDTGVSIQEHGSLAGQSKDEARNVERESSVQKGVGLQETAEEHRSGRLKKEDTEAESMQEPSVAEVGNPGFKEHSHEVRRGVLTQERSIRSHEVLHVSKAEELPQELTNQLLVKVASGRNEFEIQITPKNLGEITVRIAQEEGHSIVSIICSEKKTMELLAQSAKEIGNVMEQNLGKPTEIYVDEQKTDTLWQDGQQNNDHSGRESEQYRQKEEQEKMQKTENTRFLQELRLGLRR